MKQWLRHNRSLLAFMFLLVFFRSAIANWYPIPSSSMHPNILEGDVVFVNRLAFDAKIPFTDKTIFHIDNPQRGDIVVFMSPVEDVRLIKRVVGLPGDRVELQNNHLTINGQPQVYTRVDSKPELLENGLTVTATRLKEEGLARAHQIQILSDVSSKSTFQPIVVPDGEFLVMGDNRDNSADSRYIGFVRRDLLIGRAVGVMVSADIKGNWLPRLERFGKALN